MATITFYEKPGCANNTRQKKLLVAAAHQVIAKNILTEAWTEQSLRPFFGDLPVKDWFNYSAPAIKYGEIDPDNQTEAQALALMLEIPLLIRRPLMQIDNKFIAGFDQQLIDNWIGLQTVDTASDLESCPKTQSQSSCSHE
jgi:nitrogenase-associated protein